MPRTDPPRDSEALITLREAGRLPCLIGAGRRPGEGIDVPTLNRWCRSGHRAENRQRVILESCRINGRRMTTPAAVARFLSRINSTSPAPLPEADAARLAHARAEAELDARGV